MTDNNNNNQDPEKTEVNNFNPFFDDEQEENNEPTQNNNQIDNKTDEIDETNIVEDNTHKTKFRPDKTTKIFITIAIILILLIGAGVAVLINRGNNNNTNVAESSIVKTTTSSPPTSTTKPTKTSAPKTTSTTPTPKTTQPKTTTVQKPVETNVKPAPQKPVEPENIGGTCKTIGWVGDSTSIFLIEEGKGEVSPGGYLSDTPLAKELFNKGIQKIFYDISGGRSAVEKLPGQLNAVEAMNGLPEADCYVAAIGTNDGANISVGYGPDVEAGSYIMDQRYAQLKTAAHGKPLFAMTVKMLDSNVSGYTPAASELVNKSIFRNFNNNLIIDWAPFATTDTFAGDGIHYTYEGSEKRAAVAAYKISKY